MPESGVNQVNGNAAVECMRSMRVPEPVRGQWKFDAGTNCAAFFYERNTAKGFNAATFLRDKNTGPPAPASQFAEQILTDPGTWSIGKHLL